MENLLFRYRLIDDYVIGGKIYSTANVEGVALTAKKNIDGEYEWKIFQEEFIPLRPWLKTPENQKGIVIMQKYDRTAVFEEDKKTVAFDSASPDRTVYTASDLMGMKREVLNTVAENWGVEIGGIKKEKAIEKLVGAFKSAEVVAPVALVMPAPVIAPDVTPIVEPVNELVIAPIVVDEPTATEEGHETT